MAVLIASDIGVDIAGAPLFRSVSLKLENRDRLTLAGRNGAGKTTLLRVLAGEISADSGELVLAKGARVALHDQRPPRHEAGLDLGGYLFSARRDLIELEERLAGLETEMAAGAHDEATLQRYSQAQAALEHAGGYTWREDVLAVARGLGFSEEHLGRGLDTFSGGELTRASLARALAAAPDLLLLDEPTNHLDIASLEWLEARLQAWPGAVVLVAHDRWFLEAVGTAVLELDGAGRPEGARGRFFPGTWSAWRKEQAAREMALGRAIERQQAEIARMERFVERFRYKASKAKQAQSRVKKLDKMERITRDPGDTAGLSFGFKAPERSGRVVFEMHEGLLKTPDGARTLLADAEFWLERGEHVSLVGPNGSGKSTLIAALAGARPLDGGRLRTGHNVKLGLLSQHTDELDETGSVLQACQRATKLTPNKARALLGRFLFSGEDAEKPMSGLSGGERRRLTLAILVHSGANVLILDEPTNHLDLESREALEDALSAFQGTLLLVSHDRALLDAVGSRVIAVEEGTLHSHLGGWAEYVRERAEREELARAPKAAKAADARERRERAKPARNGANPGKAKRLEREIESAERELSALEEELADPAVWATPDKAESASQRHAAARAQLDELYARWESAAG